MKPAAINRLIKRHKAFWEMDEAEKPLIKLSPYTSLTRQGLPLRGGRFAVDNVRLTPEIVDVKAVAEWQEVPEKPVEGDLFTSVAPFGLCWTEAAVGCPIRMSVGSVWADPFLESLGDVDNLQFNPRNPWLLKLNELTNLLVEKTRGRSYVTQTLLRGPIDMAAAALGYQRLCVELYRNPDEVEKLLSVCTETFIETAKTHLSTIPQCREGFISGYEIWAPGSTVRSQTDNSVLLSPSTYVKHVLPYDRRVLQAFKYPVVHTHQPCMSQVVQPLIEAQELKALQFSLDRPNGPPVSDMIPLMRMVQEEKPLIITGPITENELKLMLQTLSPKGLCLNTSVWTEEEWMKDLSPTESTRRNN